MCEIDAAARGKADSAMSASQSSDTDARGSHAMANSGIGHTASQGCPGPCWRASNSPTALDRYQTKIRLEHVMLTQTIGQPATIHRARARYLDNGHGVPRLLSPRSQRPARPMATG